MKRFFAFLISLFCFANIAAMDTPVQHNACSYIPVDYQGTTYYRPAPVLSTTSFGVLRVCQHANLAPRPNTPNAGNQYVFCDGESKQYLLTIDFQSRQCTIDPCNDAPIEDAHHSEQAPQG